MIRQSKSRSQSMRAHDSVLVRLTKDYAPVVSDVNDGVALPYLPASATTSLSTWRAAETSMTLGGLCHRSYLNEGPSPAFLRTPAGSFLIPPRSGFNISDLTSWRPRLLAMGL